MLAAVALGASSVAPAQVAPAGAVPSVGEAVTSVANAPLLRSAVLPTADAVTREAALPAPAPVLDTPAPVHASGSLSEMVGQLRSTEAGSRELECLATAVYFESKSEPLAGQLAVGHVIANRAKSGRFAKSYCGVVFQRGQFSFIHGAALPSVPRSGQQWKTAVAIAKIVDNKLMESNVGKALFFHAKHVSPAWHASMVASIGNHLFFR
ncbi:cell wall hydrolase [Sphingomonas ginkgonis]|nr:cell wall hydrolase [Sphingomonas ginkgonis]